MSRLQVTIEVPLADYDGRKNHQILLSKCVVRVTQGLI
jgi:hypothetical protein